MSWTYTGNPASSTKDAVRFLVGDTQSGEPLVTDEEIAWALSQNSDTYAVASVIADSISTYFSRMADAEEIGPIKVEFSNRVKAYALISKQLAVKAGTKSSVIVYGGGIDVTDVLEHMQDETTTSPCFYIGMGDSLNNTDGIK